MESSMITSKTVFITNDGQQHDTDKLAKGTRHDMSRYDTICRDERKAKE